MCVGGLLPQHIRNAIMAKDIEDIRKLILLYQNALNTGSTEDAVILFTPSAVLMTHPPSIGLEVIKRTTKASFSHGNCDIKLEIKEITPTAPDWAFAWTESHGTKRSAGEGEAREGGGGGGGGATDALSQELFVLQKIKLADQRPDGQGHLWAWRIARYCSNTVTMSTGAMETV